MLKVRTPAGIEPRSDSRFEQERESLVSGPDDEAEELRATLGEHLEELRQRVVRSVTILCIAWAVGWYLEKPLYGYLSDMVSANVKLAIGNPELYREVFKNATEMFMLKLKLSFLIGLILAFPLILLQVWGFIRPGLKPRERRPLERAAPFSILLFALGGFFCWLVLPAAIRWFATYLGEFPGTALYQEPGTMVFFVLKMMLAFGIGFQLPLIVYALGAMNLLSTRTLTKNWRQASVVIFIASAVLTPSNDAISMLMMAVPLVILFMLSVWAVKLTQKRRSATLEAELAGE